MMKTEKHCLEMGTAAMLWAGLDTNTDEARAIGTQLHGMGFRYESYQPDEHAAQTIRAIKTVMRPEQVYYVH